MKLFNILQYIFLIPNLVSLNIVKLNTKKIEFHNDLKKMSLLSKLIYEYDFVNKHDQKTVFTIHPDINIKPNITFEFIKKNNIYFTLYQFASFLERRDFVKKVEKHFKLLNDFFPNSHIYGYFCNKERLYSLILINHQFKEIIVIFRGSQYIEEWIKNLCFNEIPLQFYDKFTIHKGIYNMYRDNNIDNNIIFILKNLYEYFPSYRKVLTGHSRGSINSILLALELDTKLKNKYNYEIFGFGIPPLFNHLFANYIHNHKNIKIYNIINNNDIITLLQMKNKYHIGKEILLKNNKISVKEHIKPYNIDNKFKINNIYQNILNHDLNIYIKNIFDFTLEDH